MAPGGYDGCQVATAFIMLASCKEAPSSRCRKVLDYSGTSAKASGVVDLCRLAIAIWLLPRCTSCIFIFLVHERLWQQTDDVATPSHQFNISAWITVIPRDVW